jgi:hypothetical protein
MLKRRFKSASNRNKSGGSALILLRLLNLPNKQPANPRAILAMIATAFGVVETRVNCGQNTRLGSYSQREWHPFGT